MKPADMANMNVSSPAEQNAAARASWIDRRRHTREPVLTPGVIFPVDLDDEDHRRTIFVHDVSCSGMGFRSQTHFQLEGVFQVRIGGGPLQLGGTVRIVSCRPRADGTCDIGAEFI